MAFNHYFFFACLILTGVVNVGIKCWMLISGRRHKPSDMQLFFTMQFWIYFTMWAGYMLATWSRA